MITQLYSSAQAQDLKQTDWSNVWSFFLLTPDETFALVFLQTDFKQETPRARFHVVLIFVWF